VRGEHTEFTKKIYLDVHPVRKFLSNGARIHAEKTGFFAINFKKIKSGKSALRTLKDPQDPERA